MKKLLFAFLLMTGMSFAQRASTDYMTTKESDSTEISLQRIEDRTWSFTTIDTTAPQDIRQFNSIYCALMTTDTCVVTVKYQLSLDAVNWTAVATLDSLRDTTSAVFTKNFDCSTVALGHSWIRYLFSFSKSDVYGTTYPSTLRKYWATLKLKP